jgi:hypothetical protein
LSHSSCDAAAGRSINYLLFYDVTYPSLAELETGKPVTQKVTHLGHDSGWEAGKKSELEGGMTKPAMAELGSLPPLS